MACCSVSQPAPSCVLCWMHEGKPHNFNDLIITTSTSHIAHSNCSGMRKPHNSCPIDHLLLRASLSVRPRGVMRTTTTTLFPKNIRNERHPLFAPNCFRKRIPAASPRHGHGVLDPLEHLLRDLLHRVMLPNAVGNVDVL